MKIFAQTKLRYVDNTFFPFLNAIFIVFAYEYPSDEDIRIIVIHSRPLMLLQTSETRQPFTAAIFAFLRIKGSKLDNVVSQIKNPARKFSARNHQNSFATLCIS